MKLEVEKQAEMLVEFDHRKQDRLPYEDFRDDHETRMIRVEDTFAFMRDKL